MVKVSKKTLWRAIRANCVEDCCCGVALEVEFCACPDCKLYSYRFGRPPKPEDYVWKEGDSDFEAAEMRKIHDARLAGLPEPILRKNRVQPCRELAKTPEKVSK